MFYIKKMFTSLLESWMGYHMNRSYILFDTEQFIADRMEKQLGKHMAQGVGY
jgi:hypothetical protein